MFDWLRRNAIPSRISSKKTTAFICLWILSIFLLSCDGSGSENDRVGAGSDLRQRSNYPPVVFMADKDTNNTVELYASFEDGNYIIKLSEEMVAGGNVVDFKVSPNGFWVAYVADQDTDELFELYVVPVDKLPDDSAVRVSVKIAGSGIREITARSERYFFAWAPNSSRVAYIADARKDVYELFSSTPSGKQKNLISELVDSNSDVEDFEWEPKSSLIAYVADQDREDVFELYTADADRDARRRTTRVSRAMAGRGIKESFGAAGRYAFGWAPDSSWIAYIADQLVPDKFELFTATADGSLNGRISQARSNDQDVREFKWAPNSVRVAYTANHNLSDRIDLFTGLKSSSGLNSSGSPRLLSSGLGPRQQVAMFKWAPDSSRIAYTTDRNRTGFFRLFTVQPVNINNILVSGGLPTLSDVIDFKWQAKLLVNSEVLLAYQVDAFRLELYTTLPASASSTRIKDRRFIQGGDAFDFEWAPDNSRIAYTADYIEDDVVELFSSLPNNRETFKVSGELVTGGDVWIFKWAPDSSGVGYIANQDFNNVKELYASQPNGFNNRLLSGELVDGGNVTRFEWVP